MRASRGAQDEIGPGLRLEAMRHQLAPDMCDELRRGAIGAADQPPDDLRLAARTEFECPARVVRLQRGDGDAGAEPLLDEVEKRMVKVIDLCSQPFQVGRDRGGLADRSEEHTSELQSLMRISYAVFCLKKKKNKT